AADFGYPAPILVLEKKDPPRALPILTPIVLGPVSLLPPLDAFWVLTIRTLHRNRDHRLPPRTILMQGHRTGKLLICNTTGCLSETLNSISETLPRIAPVAYEPRFTTINENGLFRQRTPPLPYATAER